VVRGGAAGIPAPRVRLHIAATAFVGNTNGSAVEVGDSYALDVFVATFEQNVGAALRFGGGIAIGGTGAGRAHTIRDVDFTGNVAGGGGAISITNGAGTLTIDESNFLNNDAVR